MSWLYNLNLNRRLSTFLLIIRGEVCLGLLNECSLTVYGLM